MKDLQERWRTFIILTKAAEVLATSGAAPEVIYGAIFSDEISRRIKGLALEPPLQWMDPDAEYMDDVNAYVAALKERAAEYQKLLDALEAKNGD